MSHLYVAANGGWVQGSAECRDLNRWSPPGWKPGRGRHGEPAGAALARLSTTPVGCGWLRLSAADVAELDRRRAKRAAARAVAP